MAGLWQRTGNVTVTNGSKTITGFGTKWKTGTLPIQKGHTFYGPDNAAYEVDTVVSDTEILLVDTYRGGTMANQPYRIDITRTSTISQFAADLASLVAKYRSWFDGMMTWLTGSGDVAILNPDTGANVTIPSWKKVTSEGEGQAARAKVEADRSKAEADRSGTEADRAAGIVALAALPLPDVWAPLSDSLRMITGYGRDVLVGSDVVARMVNFSRSTTATYIGKDGLLKTAAANEPRFEKEGLLLEGQSVNLITSSNSLPLGKLGAGVSPVATAGQLDPMGGTSAVKVTLSRTAPGPSNRSFIGSGGYPTAVFDITAVNTMSVWLRAISPTPVTLQMRIAGVSSIITVTSEWKRFSLTRPANHGNQVDGTVYFACLQDDSLLSADIVYFGGQLEQLPFASSYIPTAGAAVTRAADIVTIPWERNINPATVTVALNYDLTGLTLLQRIIEYASAVNPRYLVQMSAAGFMESFAGASAVAVPSAPYGAGSTMVAATSRTRHAFKLSGKAILSSTTDGPAQATTVVSIGSGISGGAPIYGHVRNLRIWHRTLTDDQIKAVV
ncbi:hypothetical protein C3418_01430 [Aeromonas sp. ASNIH8]|uniref:phage head spike fiber domain-containing protein n=1 Tax=Aeromonas sp. ASNIH8 TaxID=1920113 RepID=UPI000CDCEA8E|nr:hypothetical protein [Aeromonas sp. ASNIH8]POV93687.1 hypothetical protein C3418_01430 [Aeromonas sp. ASNIH8]